MTPILAGTQVELSVEIVPGLWDFWRWVQPLEAGMAGITIQVHGEVVNHMFRFVARQDLSNYRVHQQSCNWSVDTTIKDTCPVIICRDFKQIFGTCISLFLWLLGILKY